MLGLRVLKSPVLEIFVTQINTFIQRGGPKLIRIINYAILGIKNHVKRFNLSQNSIFGIFFILLIFFLILGSKSVSGEGGDSLFSKIFHTYIEETKAATYSSNPNQLADINSIGVLGINPENENALNPEIVQDTSILSFSSVLSHFDGGIRRGGVTLYTVQPGDVLSLIAQDFGVSLSALLWANKLKDSDSLSPGQTLKIPPIDGIIYIVQASDTLDKIAKRFSGDKERIIEFNKLHQDEPLEIGQEVIIPDGKIPASLAPTVARKSSYFLKLPSLGDFFLIPTQGYNWGRIHGRNGVDIANGCGTPIYSAAEGTIIGARSSGWNGGAGKYVKISHNNGTDTFYAHLNKILINIGDYVVRGQIIGIMGATGKATGCHLHFEVHGAKNPLAKY